jgi:hypothetical protein
VPRRRARKPRRCSCSPHYEIDLVGSLLQLQLDLSQIPSPGVNTIIHAGMAGN